MGILEVLFITGAITNMADKGISDTVDYFWPIDDIEIKLWKKLILAGLMVI